MHTTISLVWRVLSYARQTTTSFVLIVCFSDYGFKHSDGFVGPCIRDPDIELDDPCLTSSVASYMKSTGYRKIPGDVCTGGVKDTFDPQPFPCCDGRPTTDKPSSQSPLTTRITDTIAASETVTVSALGTLLGVAIFVGLALGVLTVVLAM